jgi:CheY-like chemotaxis protein
MASKILAAVADLIFLSKIQQTAKLTGVEVGVVPLDQLTERLSSAGLVFLDLNHGSGRSIEVLRAIKSNPATRTIQIIGFLSHVQADLARAAREAGCDVVMARSAFTQRLPQLLRSYAPKETAVPE